MILSLLLPGGARVLMRSSLLLTDKLATNGLAFVIVGNAIDGWSLYWPS